MNPYIYIVSKFVFDSVLDMLGFIEVSGSQRNFPIIRKKNSFKIYLHFLCFFVSGLSVCLSVCFFVSLIVFGRQLIVSHQLFQCHLQYHVLVSPSTPQSALLLRDGFTVFGNYRRNTITFPAGQLFWFFFFGFFLHALTT